MNPAELILRLLSSGDVSITVPLTAALRGRVRALDRLERVLTRPGQHSPPTVAAAIQELLTLAGFDK